VNLRLLDVVTVNAATRLVFRYLGIIHAVAAAVIVVFGGFSLLAASALTFVIASAVVNGRPAYRRSPFALIASFATCLSFVIPLAFVAASGEGFRFGDGLLLVPGDPEGYRQAAPIAIAFLTLLFLAGVCGLCLGSRRREPPIAELAHGLSSDLPVMLLGGLVLFFSYQSTVTFLNIRVTGDSTAESFWQFIFFDQAFLMLLPIVVSWRLTQSPQAGQRRLAWQLGVILFLFYLQATLGSTSKGFILTLFVVSFVMPLSYFENSRAVRLFMPSRNGLVAALVTAVPVFFVVQGLRVAAFSGDSINLATIFASLFRPAESPLMSVLSDVAYRLSAGLDRYILIFDAHLYRGHSWSYAAEFGEYIAKNLANLLLLGTPYPEAYSPSSNLLVSVLFRQPMFGDMTKAELIRSLNTQPYTLYGVAVILGGLWAPVIVFGALGGAAVVYRLMRGVPARVGLIAFYNLLISSYGFEVNVATALHFAGSLLFFLWFMRSARWIRRLLTPTVRLKVDQQPVAGT